MYQWSKQDEQRLIKLWQNGTPVSRLAELFNRSPRAIYSKLMRLRAMYGSDTIPLRFLESIKRRAWTQEEVAYLREKYQVLTLNQLAKRLHRSPWAVHAKATRLGLTSPRSTRGVVRRPWTDKEVEKLYALAESHTIEEIARQLGRTPGSVKHKIEREGIPFKSLKVVWSANYVAELLGVHRSTIVNRWIPAGLKANRTKNQYTIHPKDLREFLRSHPDSFNLYRVTDQRVVKDLLLGNLG